MNETSSSQTKHYDATQAALKWLGFFGMIIAFLLDVSGTYPRLDRFFAYKEHMATRCLEKLAEVGTISPGDEGYDQLAPLVAGHFVFGDRSRVPATSIERMTYPNILKGYYSGLSPQLDIWFKGSSISQDIGLTEIQKSIDERKQQKVTNWRICIFAGSALIEFISFSNVFPRYVHFCRGGLRTVKRTILRARRMISIL